MFGRKKHAPDDADPEIDDDPAVELPDDDTDAAHGISAGGGDPDEDDKPEREAPKDEWEIFDASQDWRADGPFDISEVDLDADDVERLDFGCLVLTPFDGMQLQLQVNQQTQEVQAILILEGQSVLELSLFAAPSDRVMLGQVRDEMLANTSKDGGTFTLSKGPFGTEVRRVVPITTPDGQHGYHVSRTWFAQGPRWLLRGVVMGEAGLSEGSDGPGELLYEFFANTVVRRGDRPMVPGDLITLSLPESLKNQPAAD
ncbi:DUF3710 domain-containing protein [Propionibacterium sp.]|uniref:DUF3710 domain-containing protein n=1 Tax=Propionibacterium sp. TaxID=1977903 RepID=UPI0039EBBB04